MNKQAFTLMEMMVAAVILGVLAVIAVTRYGSVAEKQRADTARQNLEAIYAASNVYAAQMRSVPSGRDKNVDFINNTFKTNIREDGTFTYRYNYDSGNNLGKWAFWVIAYRTTGAYTIYFKNDFADAGDVYTPVCEGACP